MHSSKFQHMLRKRHRGRTEDHKLIQAFEHGKRHAGPAFVLDYGISGPIWVPKKVPCDLISAIIATNQTIEILRPVQPTGSHAVVLDSWLGKKSQVLNLSYFNPDCAVASSCDSKILAATLVSRFCSSTYLWICLCHKITPTARFAVVFCVSIRILLHNLGLSWFHVKTDNITKVMISRSI
jgi:hypothetical protein